MRWQEEVPEEDGYYWFAFGDMSAEGRLQGWICEIVEIQTFAGERHAAQIGCESKPLRRWASWATTPVVFWSTPLSEPDRSLIDDSDIEKEELGL